MVAVTAFDRDTRTAFETPGSAVTTHWEEPDPLIGRKFDGRYDVQERIGRGGMGSVYRATQLSVGRELALKVLSPELAKNPDMAGRFMREAQVASRLRHPNTIVIHDFGSTSDGLFMAMELLHGETLHDRLRRLGKLTLLECVSVAKAIAGSLAEAHKGKVVHRDIKPDNIFLHKVGELEVVKVLDFGIAKFFQTTDQTAAYEDSYETSVGVDGRRPIIGTWHYMAPEQIESKPIDSRADLYSLGIVIYEMAAGHKPFQGDTMAAMLRMHLLEPPMPLPDTVPTELALVVHRLLEKDPNRRFATADELVAALDQVDQALRSGRASQRSPGLGARRVTVPPRGGSDGSPIDAQAPAAVAADRLKRWLATTWEKAHDWIEPHLGAIKGVAIALVALTLLILGAIWLREHRGRQAKERAETSAIVAPVAVPSTAPLPPPIPPPRAQDPEPAAPVSALPPESDPRSWARIAPARFDMGTADADANRNPDEVPIHPVELTHALLARTTEITQAEWRELMGNQPSGHAGCEECPVDSVNWYEAVAFANALSKQRGHRACYELQECRGKAGEGLHCRQVVFQGTGCDGYRLPTEAEWEYLARSGGSGSGTEALEASTWYAKNSGGRTHVVGQASANALGIRNLLGNVWEWVNDVYSDKYYAWALPKDPEGPGTGPVRVIRGCSFASPAAECRAGLRRPREPMVIDATVGFRLVRTVP